MSFYKSKFKYLVHAHTHTHKGMIKEDHNIKWKKDQAFNVFSLIFFFFKENINELILVQVQFLGRKLRSCVMPPLIAALLRSVSSCDRITGYIKRKNTGQWENCMYANQQSLYDLNHDLCECVEIQKY